MPTYASISFTSHISLYTSCHAYFLNTPVLLEGPLTQPAQQPIYSLRKGGISQWVYLAGIPPVSYLRPGLMTERSCAVDTGPPLLFVEDCNSTVQSTEQPKRNRRVQLQLKL